LEYARIASYPAAGVVYGMFEEKPSLFPFSFVVARSDAGIVLCDCGFMNEGRSAELIRKFGVDSWVSPVALLGEIGISRNDVTAVFISHAHYDHMGSIAQFPGAHIYLQKQELLSWIEALALPPRYGFLTEAIDPASIVSAIASSVEHRLTLLEGDADDVLPGIHVRLVPGHTMGHQIILLDSAVGRYAVSGDCIYSMRNLTGEGCDHQHRRYMPLGNGVGSVWDQLKSFDRLEAAVAGDLDRIIILHDQRRWPNFEKIKEVDGHGIYRVA